jgi:DNA-binding HxlR family transcriptional regulator
VRRPLQFVKHYAKLALLMASDDTCPVCRTAEIVCGKWTLLVIRDLAEGRSRFCELERSLHGISPRTLSLRLRALEEEGVVERQTFPEVPPRVEYALTEKGRALVPLIEDMRRYGREWLGASCDDAAEPSPAEREPAVVAA